MITERFTRLLFRHAKTGFIEFTYILPEGVPAPHRSDGRAFPRIFTRWHAVNDLKNADWPRIAPGDQRGYSAYVGMTVRRRIKPVGQRGTKADALWLTHLWCDLDDITTDEGTNILNNAHFPASLIVHSGGGIHGYWLLRKPVEVTESNRDDIERTLQGVAVAMGTRADRSVRDLARVLRLPGTINTKPHRNGAMCDLIGWNGEGRSPVQYDYADLAAKYLVLGAAPQPKVTRDLPAAALSMTSEIPTAVQNYIDHGARDGERNSTLFFMARLCNDYGISEIEVGNLLAARAQQDGLPEQEIVSTIASAYRYSPDLSKRIDDRFSLRMAAADATLRNRGVK